MEQIRSGFYATFGTERKDLITEATAQEFRDWVAIKGFNIDFISDMTLNGEHGRKPLSQWEIRLAFIMDIENSGAVVERDEKDWSGFLEKYSSEAKRLYG